MLDELVDVIETLKSRINEHRSDLQKDETRTRMALINPLLQALGWDTSNPGVVTPEYSLSNGRADYALLDYQGKVVVFLEAKRLGEQLARHRSQVDDYARDIGCRYPALTDGDNWEIYDRAKYDVPSSQSHILKLSIVGDPSYKCALQFLLLWRPNMATGQPIEASQPIMETEPDDLPTTEPNETPEQNVPPPPGEGWVSLKDFVATPGTTPPKLRFPGGDELQPSNWRGLLIEVAEWLIRDGVLTQDRCPVTVGKNAAYSMVNLQPKHPNGKDFYASHPLSNGLFLAPHANASNIVHKCRAIMEHLGRDPATVHVQAG